MIDFRYHLVSLISVFLALAVGIVLGAGPLQGPIGSSLTSQVDGLRADRDALREDLDASRAQTEQTAAFVEATASDLVADSLEGRTVALVRTAGADHDQADAIAARIAEAGGTVASDVNFTESTFSSPDDSLVTALRDADDSLPEDDAAVVTAGLARALGAAPEADDAEAADDSAASPTPDPTAAGTDEEADARAASEALFEVLSDAGRIERGEWAAADAVVVLAPGVEAAVSPSPSATPTEGAEDAAAAQSATTIALSGFASALAGETTTIVAGPSTSAAAGVLADLRADRIDLSTVDGTDLATGAVLVPLVTEAALDGTFGDYGTGAGATAVLPDTAQ